MNLNLISHERETNNLPLYHCVTQLLKHGFYIAIAKIHFNIKSKCGLGSIQITVIRMFLPIDFKSDKYHDEHFLHLINNIIVFNDVLLFVCILCVILSVMARRFQLIYKSLVLHLKLEISLTVN